MNSTSMTFISSTISLQIGEKSKLRSPLNLETPWSSSTTRRSSYSYMEALTSLKNVSMMTHTSTLIANGLNLP